MKVMEIPENLLNYIKDQAKKVHHGRITIEINATNNKMDVVVESRERFGPKNPKDDSKNAINRD